jgi:Protein of unknown function (DUF2934)
LRCLTFLFDGANKTNLGQIVSGQSKIQTMQSGKSTQKSKKNVIESHPSPEVIAPMESSKTPKRAAKPVASAPAAAKEAKVTKPKSLSAKSRLTSSERTTHSTSLHRPAKPASVPAEATPETPLASATVEEKKAPISKSTPRHFTHDDVSKLAYSYWLARGKHGGNAHEDWIRAERELRSKA